MAEITVAEKVAKHLDKWIQELATKPDWQLGIDWAIGDSGPPNCPELYLGTYPECLASGNRSCLMRKAIQSAKDGDCNNAFRLTLITQCHNPAAAQALAAAGSQAVCDYLKTK